MRWPLAILLIVAVAGLVSAQNIKVDFKLSPTEFFGFCNETQIEKNNVGAWLECGGNFVSPMLPNPLHILDPVSGAQFWSNLGLIKDQLLSLNFLQGLWNVIQLVILTIIGLIVSALKYIIVFAIRFVFVYLFYISLGLQAIIYFADKNSSGLDSRQKIEASVGWMILATIFILAIGGGWAQWS